MSQAATLKFASEPVRKPGIAVKLFVVLLILAFAVAAFFCWQHFNPFSHKPVAATTERPAPVAAVPAAANPVPAAAKSSQPNTIKSAIARFINSMVALFKPSAKAAAVQPQTPPVIQPAVAAALPAKQIPLQPAVAPPHVYKPVVLTPAQQRLQVAQDGFDHAMDLAMQHRSAYGFLPDEDMGAATLGSEIPLYTIKRLGRDKFANQQVSSLLQPANEWLYPVMLNNHVRYFVHVQSDGQNYVLGNGSHTLAVNYEKILAQWPPGKGFHPKLITVPGLPAYYFTIPELPDQNITDTDRMLDYNPSLSPASIVLANCQ